MKPETFFKALYAGIDTKPYANKSHVYAPLTEALNLTAQYRLGRLYGLYSKENLDLLRRGRAPVITKGEHKGQKAHVDHILPITKNTLILTTALISSHLLAVLVGSSLQARSQNLNSHAHLSDVGDAITLGEYFSDEASTPEGRAIAARASAAIIYRILESSRPGSNSTSRLGSLQEELYARFPKTSNRVLATD